MAVLRTEIITALEEIVSNEEGMRFQGLAVTLAKQRWPQLIACERKKDLGLDAHAPAILAHDNVGIGLGSSISEGYDKIEGDAKRAKEHFSDLKTFIFYSPHKVTNQTQEAWRADLLKATQLHLVMVTREDVINSLMQPENAAICAAQLHIAVPLAPETHDKVKSATEASAISVASWGRRAALAAAPLIPLTSIALKQDGSDSEDEFQIADIHQALDEGRRLILEGPAGQGKTTLLTQVADDRLKAGKIALLVDLPDWVRSRRSILEFVAAAPPFASRGLTNADLAKLAENVQLTFCLNGWNEISAAFSDEGVRALSELERDFPSAGIILATRNHTVAPPLPGSKRIRLRRITPRQRTVYIHARLGSAGDALVSRIEQRPVLAELTLTPLFLSEVIGLHAAGKAIPETRFGILRAILDALEQAEHHRAALAQPPLAGHARRYLIDIAGEMTARFGTRLDDADAHRSCQLTGEALKLARQVSEVPEPAAVLSALISHHCLERVDYPTISYRFGHQQFQEYLASEFVAQRFAEHMASPSDASRASLTATFFNKPFWSEPIRMLIERYRDDANAGDGHAIAASAEALNMALSVDPVFASELAFIAGPAVWPTVRPQFEKVLRAWYAVDSEPHKACAAEAMLATGSEDFSDIIVPLFADHHKNFRVMEDTHFHISCFGPDWQKIVQSWGQEAREAFLLDAIQSGEIRRDFTAMMKAEPSALVRSRMMDQYTFHMSDADTEKAMAEMDDDALALTMSHLPPNYVPQPLRERAIKALRTLVSPDKKPMQNVNIFLHAHLLGDAKAVPDMKSELDKMSKQELADDYHRMRQMVDIIAEVDRGWAQTWVTERLNSGSLWSAGWRDYLAPLSSADRLTRLAEFSASQRDYRADPTYIAILVTGADAAFAKSAFLELCRLRRIMGWRPGQGMRAVSESYSRVEGVLLALPKKIMVDGILSQVAGGFDLVEYRETMGLIGRIGRDPNTYPQELGDASRVAIHTYIKGRLGFVLAEQDYSGSLKQEYSLSISRVGEASDLADIDSVIAADIARHEAGIAVLRKGGTSEQGNGARMCHISWHLHALDTLDAPGTDDLLVRLMDDDYYRQEAALGLLRRIRVPALNADMGSTRVRPAVVWAARENGSSLFDPAKLPGVVTSIKAKIAQLEAAQAGTDKPDQFAGALKGVARLLALADPIGSRADILRLTVHFRFNGWNSLEAMKFLLEGGASVTTVELDGVLGPVMAEAEKDGFWNDQNVSPFISALCMFGYVSDQDAGIAYIKAALERTKLRSFQVRDLIECLGGSRSDAAAKFIVGLNSMGDPRTFAREELEALCNLDTPSARAAILATIDPAAPDAPVNAARNGFVDVIAVYLSGLAKGDSAVRDAIFGFARAGAAGQKREIIIATLAAMGTMEALLLSLELLVDAPGGGLTYQLFRQIEDTVVEKRPVDGSGSAYSLHPRDGNVLRRRLVEMAKNDPKRRKSALEILGQIELSRHRWGRPKDEDRHPALDMGISWPVVG